MDATSTFDTGAAMALGLHPRAFVLWWHLAVTDSLAENRLPRRDDLAISLRCSRSSVQRALRELRENHVLGPAGPPS